LTIHTLNATGIIIILEKDSHASFAIGTIDPWNNYNSNQVTQIISFWELIYTLKRKVNEKSVDYQEAMYIV
jgi:hypothetical protein